MSTKDEAFRLAVKRFTEKKYPMVGLEPEPTDHSTDNGLLFTATFISILEQTTYKDIQDIYFLVGACTLEPGLYARYPGDKGFNSHDDLTGVAYMGYRLGLGFPKDIVAYGRKHFWAWNTETPGKWTTRAFLGRIAGLIAFFKCCAGEPLGVWDQISFAAGCIWGTREPRSESSGKRLQVLKNEVVQGRYFLCDLAIAYWSLRMRRQYPCGMRELNRVYFQHEEHPFHLFEERGFG